MGGLTSNRDEKRIVQTGLKLDIEKKSLSSEVFS